MSDDQGKDGFFKSVEPVIRLFLENIESPYVYTPLGLFVLCILAYPVTNMEIFPYLAIAFVVLAFVADWIGRYRNRKTPTAPVPEEPLTSAAGETSVADRRVASPGYQEEIRRHLSSIQYKALEMIRQRKRGTALRLIEKNLQDVDEALRAYPDDAVIHAIKGFMLKDVYQGSRGLFSPERRQIYLNRAREAFEEALRLDPNDANAHNGMGNVLLFEGHFDEALKEIDKALAIAPDYSSARSDRELVLRAKRARDEGTPINF